ncbi:cobalamin-binding protein [Hydrogenovibrio sp. SC-1]|uniref:cobalamin-binding protein n=1 Tax=Hydrogenovibrio sp. SC-1 TaxID=2065820 RepID=UPI000C7C80C9|nr:cobalamin-binding protein [Hydrogenovibrio sp. SC-1]PLA73595.1 cobalamin-binding protein [Hydrogenovibrio sp. SC-1]
MRFFARLPVLSLLLIGLYLASHTVNAKPTHPPPHATPRLVSLAPSFTELVFAAGAGHHLVGAVEYSDYPLAARSIARVGSLNALNYEALLQLKPDVILVWRSGSSAQEIRRLQQLGFQLWIRESQQLAEIPSLIREIGELTGHQRTANQEAQRLQVKLHQLRQQYRHRPPLRVFYQLWDAPLITVNGDQFISQALDICGAKNSFADLPLLAPQVNYEAVIQQNPQVILLGGQPERQRNWQQKWQRFDQIEAVTKDQFIQIESDAYQRPTGRLIDALEGLCQQLDRFR